MPPLVPGRSATLPELSHLVDHDSQVSASKDLVCPINCSLENPIFAQIPSSTGPPEISSFSDVGCSSSCSKILPLSVSSQVPSCFGSNLELSPSQSTPFLYSSVASAFSSIPTSSGIVCTFPTPIWNPHSQMMPMVHAPFQSVFNFDLNFRSTNFPSQTLTPSAFNINYSMRPSPFLNSSSHLDRFLMGNVSPLPISGNVPLIGNTQIPIFAQIPATSQVNKSPPPSDPADSGTGFRPPSFSPSQCATPTGDRRVNSVESIGPFGRFDSAVYSTVASTKSDPKVVVPPPISFKYIFAPMPPRSQKKSFDDVLNSMDDLPAPTLLNGIPGIRFPDEGPGGCRHRCPSSFSLALFMVTIWICWLGQYLGGFRHRCPVGYFLALYFEQYLGGFRHRCSSCISMDRLLVDIRSYSLWQFLGGITHFCHVGYFLDLLGVSFWDVSGSDSHTPTPIFWIIWYLCKIVFALYFDWRPYLHSDSLAESYPGTYLYSFLAQLQTT